jgi:hypothetical protein
MSQKSANFLLNFVRSMGKLPRRKSALWSVSGVFWALDCRTTLFYDGKTPRRNAAFRQTAWKWLVQRVSDPMKRMKRATHEWHLEHRNSFTRLAFCMPGAGAPE